jgi:hypothetical protein
MHIAFLQRSCAYDTTPVWVSPSFNHLLPGKILVNWTLTINRYLNYFRTEGQPPRWFYSITDICGGQASLVGIATGYGLNGPRIESQWKRDFSQTTRPTLGPTQPPVQWIPGLSRG